MSVTIKKRVAIAAACLVMILAAPPRFGLTHPHVWVDYSVEAVFHAEGLAGFRLRWVFDEMFSNEIMQMFNLRGSVINPAQVRAVKEGAFDNLRSHNYFSHVWIDGQEFPVRYVRDFNARIKGHHLIYEFFVPSPVAAVNETKTVRFQNLDREFFVDFNMLGSQSAQIANAPGLVVDHEISGNPARFLQIRFRKSP